MTNVEYYNNFSKIYDLIYSEEYIGKQTEQEVNFIYKYLKPNSVLVDIGCGSGRHIDKFISKCRQIVGIDNSREMLKLAQKKYRSERKIKFIYQGVENLSDVGLYDVAIMIFTVVNHIINENDLKRGFKNIFNSLKDGGVYIFDLTNFYSFLESYKSQLNKIYRNNDAICIRFNSHSIDEYNQMFINDEFAIYSDNKTVFNYSNRVCLKMYSVGEIKQYLLNVGFADIKIFSNWSFVKAKQTKRHIFVCKK